MKDNDVEFDLFHRDILACIRMLYGNPAFSKVMSYRPRKCYADKGRQHRLFTELHTSNWWNEIQVCAAALASLVRCAEHLSVAQASCG